MTREEYDNFCQTLKSKGYKKYSTYHYKKDDYAWYKSFGESKYEDDRSNYQMCFDVYDFSEFAHRVDDDPFIVEPQVKVSRSVYEQIDLHLSSTGYESTDIDAMEKLASNFFNWVDIYCPIPKEK